jgi:hypothetical protein
MEKLIKWERLLQPGLPESTIIRGIPFKKGESLSMTLNTQNNHMDFRGPGGRVVTIPMHRILRALGEQVSEKKMPEAEALKYARDLLIEYGLPISTQLGFHTANGFRYLHKSA